MPSGPQMKTWSTALAGTMWVRRSFVLARQAAVQDRDVLLLLAEHVEHREAPEMAVLQLLERRAEQHVGHGPVAVEQEEAAFGLAREHAADDRQDGRDARARRKAGIGPILAGRPDLAEAAGRRHHVDGVPGWSASFAKLEKAPLSTRFTPIRNSPSSGPEQIE
jgi:hypothetical protein